MLLPAQAAECTFLQPLSLCSSFCTDKTENGEVYQRKKVAVAGLPEGTAHSGPVQGNLGQPGVSSWRRIALLILAITIHNVPGEDWSWGCLPPAVGSRHCPHSCVAGTVGRDMSPIWRGVEATLCYGLFISRMILCSTSHSSCFK